MYNQASFLSSFGQQEAADKAAELLNLGFCYLTQRFCDLLYSLDNIDIENIGKYRVVKGRCVM